MHSAGKHSASGVVIVPIGATIDCCAIACGLPFWLHVTCYDALKSCSLSLVDKGRSIYSRRRRATPLTIAFAVSFLSVPGLTRFHDLRILTVITRSACPRLAASACSQPSELSQTKVTRSPTPPPPLPSAHHGLPNGPCDAAALRPRRVHQHSCAEQAQLPTPVLHVATTVAAPAATTGAACAARREPDRARGAHDQQYAGQGQSLSVLGGVHRT
jgi:hypothetical protein